MIHHHKKYRIPSSYDPLVIATKPKKTYTITLMYLVCPDLLCAVGETSYWIRVWFIESHMTFTICLFIYLFLFEI